MDTDPDKSKNQPDPEKPEMAEPVPTTDLSFATLGEILTELRKRFVAGVVITTQESPDYNADDFSVYKWGGLGHCIGLTRVASRLLEVSAVSSAGLLPIYGVTDTDDDDEPGAEFDPSSAEE